MHGVSPWRLPYEQRCRTAIGKKMVLLSFKKVAEGNEDNMRHRMWAGNRDHQGAKADRFSAGPEQSYIYCEIGRRL